MKALASGTSSVASRLSSSMRTEVPSGVVMSRPIPAAIAALVTRCAKQALPAGSSTSMRAGSSGPGSLPSARSTWRTDVAAHEKSWKYCAGEGRAVVVEELAEVQITEASHGRHDRPRDEADERSGGAEGIVHVEAGEADRVLEDPAGTVDESGGHRDQQRLGEIREVEEVRRSPALPHVSGGPGVLEKMVPDGLQHERLLPARIEEGSEGLHLTAPGDDPVLHRLAGRRAAQRKLVVVGVEGLRLREEVIGVDRAHVRLELVTGVERRRGPERSIERTRLEARRPVPQRKAEIGELGELARGHRTGPHSLRVAEGHGRHRPDALPRPHADDIVAGEHVDRELVQCEHHGRRHPRQLDRPLPELAMLVARADPAVARTLRSVVARRAVDVAAGVVGLRGPRDEQQRQRDGADHWRPVRRRSLTPGMQGSLPSYTPSKPPYPPPPPPPPP